MSWKTQSLSDRVFCVTLGPLSLSLVLTLEPNVHS